MTKTEAKALHARALACLKREFGDTVTTAGGTIGATQTTLKFLFRTADDAKFADHLRQNFDLIAPSLNLLPSDFDLPLRYNSLPCKLVQVSFRSSRYPFVIELATGKRWKVTGDVFLLARMTATSRQPAPVYKSRRNGATA